MDKRPLLDDEGENRALRSFLMQYSCDRSITVGAMLAHMSMAGWRDTAPAFALEVRPETHLTKAGAGIWIRHLLSLEAQAEPVPEVAGHAPRGWWVGEMRAIFNAAAGDGITLDMKRAANIVLKIVAGEKFDSNRAEWIMPGAQVVGASPDPVVEANRKLLLDRSRVGVEKYGVTLAGAGLPRGALLQHALEEALDLANYLQTLIQADAMSTATRDAKDGAQ